KSGHVAARIYVEALTPARPHPRLGSEVKDHLSAIEQRFERVDRQVGFHETEGLVLERPFEVGALELGRVVVGERIHRDDSPSALQAGFAEMGSHEPRSAGYDNVHMAPFDSARSDPPAAPSVRED